MPRAAEATEVADFVYEQLPQRIVFGWGRVDDLPDEVHRLRARRVLLVSERSTRPVAGDVRRRLGDEVADVIDTVRPHVPRQDVDAAVARSSTADVDLVVTIGGGSATGLGKAIVLEQHVPLIAVPTTYAGSEVTPIYGITEAGRKRTGRDDRVLPRTVLYDPELTTSLPAGVTASSGMNAIAHAIEALYARAQNPVARLLAEEAIAVLCRSLPACVRDPQDKPGRGGALYGAHVAGTVLATTGMAIHHRICHVLGGTFGLPHGEVNAVVLPHAVAFNEPASPEAVARAAAAMGATECAPALFDFARWLGAPTSLQELGLQQSDLDEAAALVVEDDFYNPRPAGRDQVLEILEAAFAGRRPPGGERKGAP